MAKSKTRKKKYDYDMARDGVTQSMVTAWLNCREQCRLNYCEGLSSNTTSMGLHYGSGSHHVLEHVYDNDATCPTTRQLDKLIDGFDSWFKKHNPKMSKAMIQQHEHVLFLLSIVLPEYFKRCDTKKKGDLYNDFGGVREWIGIEHRFREPYPIDMGERMDDPTPPLQNMTLRGMMDGVFRRRGKLWLFETKNYSRIDERSMADSLPRNFQVLFYLTVMQLMFPKEKVGGVLYNILRRPSQRRADGESLKQYMFRIREDIRKRPDHYFLRFEISFTSVEIREFQEKTLGPILREIWRWYNGGVEHYVNPEALVGKYGKTAYFNAIVKNDRSGLRVRSVPFPELES